MVCTNYLFTDDHDSEDCIWDGYISDDDVTSTSLISLPKTEAADDSGMSPTTASSTDDNKPPQAINQEQVLMTTTGSSRGGENQSSTPASSLSILALVEQGPRTSSSSTPIGRSPLGFTTLGIGPRSVQDSWAGPSVFATPSMTLPIITDEALQLPNILFYFYGFYSLN